MITQEMVDTFVDAEIKTLLWCTNQEDSDESLSEDFGIEDLHPEVYEQLWQEAKDFMTGNPEISELMEILQTSMIEQAGHDFALTRNRHGSGFWDGWDRPNFSKDWGETLTKWAQAYGGVDMYVGDDGKIYI